MDYLVNSLVYPGYIPHPLMQPFQRFVEQEKKWKAEKKKGKSSGGNANNG